MIRTQVQLTTKQHQSLRRLLKQQDRSLSELVREAVDAYLARLAIDDVPRSLAEVAGRFRPLVDLELKNHDKVFADTIQSSWKK